MNFEAGSVVWAKMKGYPYWPSVLTNEASTGLFTKGMKTSTKFHVRFLGGVWAPSWLPKSRIRQFKKQDTGNNREKRYWVCKKWEFLHLKAMKDGLKILAKVKPKKTENESKKKSLLSGKISSNVPNGSSRKARNFYPCEKPSLISSAHLKDWKKPYQCQYCLNRFGWSLERDSHQVTCEGEVNSKVKNKNKEEDGSNASGMAEKNSKRNKKILAKVKPKKTKNESKKSLLLGKISSHVPNGSSRRARNFYPCEKRGLINSAQLKDWKKPYQCQYCLNGFGWSLERDSHQVTCEGEVNSKVKNKNKEEDGSYASGMSEKRSKTNKNFEVESNLTETKPVNSPSESHSKRERNYDNANLSNTSAIDIQEDFDDLTSVLMNDDSHEKVDNVSNSVSIADKDADTKENEEISQIPAANDEDLNENIEEIQESNNAIQLANISITLTSTSRINENMTIQRIQEVHYPSYTFRF